MKHIFQNSIPKVLLSALLLIPALISCEYKPAEKFNNGSTKPVSIPPVTMDLNLLTDTIRFYWASKITLKLDAGSLNIHTVRFLLDGNELTVYQNQNIYYTTLDFSESGTHKFEAEVTTGTGSNSIADKLGKETFLFTSREWTLIALPPGDGPNLTYTLDRSGLNFKWKKYEGTEFLKYIIKEQSTGMEFEIDSNSFRNVTYAGEASYYEVYVVDRSFNEYLWGSCYVNKSLPQLEIRRVGNHVALTWQKCTFSENISECRLFQYVLPSEWVQIDSFSPDDTTYVIPEAQTTFGPYVSYFIYFVPKEYIEIQNESQFSSMINYVCAAHSGPKYSNHLATDCNSFYFYQVSSLSQKLILTRYSTLADSVTELMEYNGWSVFSPNAVLLLIPQDSVMDLFDLHSDRIITSAKVRNNVPAYRPSLEPKISDNGISVFGVNDTIYAYDILNDKLIASGNLQLQTLRISADGNYFSGFRSDSLFIFHIGVNSLDMVSFLKQSGTMVFPGCDFLAEHPGKMYFYEPPEIVVRNCNDMSTDISFTIDGPVFSIDPCRGWLLTAQGNYWYIYDVSTGELVRDILSGFPAGTGSESEVFIVNNLLFFPGYKFLIQGNL
jgi:hypothetical protein